MKIKKLWYRIQDKIAIRFLKKQFNLEFAGKTLAIAHLQIIKECINKNTNSIEMNYIQGYEGKEYKIKYSIIIS